MAYLDLNAIHPFEATAQAATPVARLTSQERLVVLLSRKDPLWSLQPRKAHSLLRFLFGIEAPHSLADRKLETLRRYAVTYRLRDAGVNDAEAAAADAGFAVRQLAQVRLMIDGARASQPRRTAGNLIRQALFALVALLVVAGATAWFSPRFDSSLISFVFVAVAILSFASFAAKEPARR